MSDDLIEEILISDFDKAKRLIEQYAKKMCESQREVCADVFMLKTPYSELDEQYKNEIYSAIVNAPLPLLLQ